MTDATLRAILDAMPGKFFLKDAKNNIILANRHVAESLGVHPEELDNTPTARWYPDHAARYYEDDKVVLRSGQPQLGIVEPLLVDGVEEHWIRTDKFPHRNDQGDIVGVIVFIRDTTEEAKVESALRASEQALRQSNEDLTRVLSSVSDYLWSATFGPDGTVTSRYYSPVVESITGRPPEFFEKNPDRWLETIHPEDRPRIEELAGRLIAGAEPALTDEYRIVLPTGKTRWVRDRVTARQLDDGSLRLDGVVTDISDHKKAKDEEARLDERIRQTQKLESLGVLAGGVAHDFNNILTAIMGNAALAREDVSPVSPVGKHLSVIESASERAAELCRQMLAYAGKSVLANTVVDLSQVVRETTTLLEVFVPKNATIELNFADSPLPVMADPAQVQQVVLNLITNASEAIDHDGVVSIRTGKRTCDPSYWASTYLGEPLPTGEYAFVEVTDTGCGMDAATRAKIFDPFFTTKFTGRGLGLAAVLGIVRGHQGAIQLHSTPGEGTSFKILFPLSSRPASAAKARTTSPDAWRGAGTILVVDDESTIRALAKVSLEAVGFDVVTAVDGREALDAFRRQPHDFALVVLDLTMPGIGGEEVLVGLRETRKDVRVILSSGYDEQDAVRRCAGDRPESFLRKPYRPRELVAAVRRVI